MQKRLTGLGCKLTVQWTIRFCPSKHSFLEKIFFQILNRFSQICNQLLAKCVQNFTKMNNLALKNERNQNKYFAASIHLLDLGGNFEWFTTVKSKEFCWIIGMYRYWMYNRWMFVHIQDCSVFLLASEGIQFTCKLAWWVEQSCSTEIRANISSYTQHSTRTRVWATCDAFAFVYIRTANV